MRAAIYARVSSEAQRDRQTVASQLSTLPAFAASRGWRVVATFVDDGKSADTGNLEARAGLAQLQEAATRGELDVVVVVDLDRLTRSADWIERGQVYGPLQRAGVKIAVSSTGAVIDFADEAGELQLGIGNMQSSGWLKKHKERTLRGKLEAIAQGRKPSGPTPFGYLYDRSTRAWSIDPELGPVVREIFRRVADGETCFAIADDLQARGIPRARPSKSGRRAPGRWQHTRVWQIARARTYLGEWVADRRRDLRVPVPPLISHDDYDAAQCVLGRDGKRGLSRAKHVYLCDANLATCAYCDAPMRVSAGALPGRGRPRPAYYVCQRRRAPDDRARCMLPMRLVAEVDARLWSAIERLLSRPDALRDAVSRRKRRAEADASSWRCDARAATQALERLARTELVVLERHRRGLVSERGLDVELRQVTRERAQREQELIAARAAGEGAQRERVAAETAVEAAAALWRGVARATDAERRELVRALIPLGGVTLGATEVEATLLLRDPLPDVAPAFAAGSSSKSRSKRKPSTVRIVG